MNLDCFKFLGISRNFSASIGSFQRLPAETSEVILLSQRLALKYNTTPPDDCQHFLTSFFQFLCGGGRLPLPSSPAAMPPSPRGRLQHCQELSHCARYFSIEVNGVRPLSQALSSLTALPKGEPRALPETSSLHLTL